jgi:glyoxylase-like metal-dependent hydrolase (beta-lactamase superfamily II)
VSERVAPGVWRFGTRFVNWYAIEKAGRLTVIDTGLAGYLGDLDVQLEAIGATRADVDAVVLTHADGDHIGMAAAFADAGADVLIHRADAGQLREPEAKGGDARPTRMLRYLHRPEFARFVTHMLANGWSRAAPVERFRSFDDGDTLDVAVPLRATHTPGHTLGHCVLLLEDHGVLFTGDALSTWDPFTGARGPRLMSSPAHFDSAQARRSYEHVLEIDAEVLLPGHGDPHR